MGSEEAKVSEMQGGSLKIKELNIQREDSVRSRQEIAMRTQPLVHDTIHADMFTNIRQISRIGIAAGDPLEE
jgi:hypothetical protein